MSSWFWYQLFVACNHGMNCFSASREKTVICTESLPWENKYKHQRLHAWRHWLDFSRIWKSHRDIVNILMQSLPLIVSHYIIHIHTSNMFLLLNWTFERRAISTNQTWFGKYLDAFILQMINVLSTNGTMDPIH